MKRNYSRPSARVNNDRRWPALRLAAKRRDGWRCIQCQSRLRLEVDHIRPVRDDPDRAFDLSNLQVLCAACHARKTRSECGLPPGNPKRKQWLDLITKQNIK